MLENLKIFRDNLKNTRRNNKILERNSNIDLIYKVFTKEELENINLSIMINSDFWIGGSYTAKTIKESIIKYELFTEEEKEKIKDIILYVDGIQKQYDEGKMSYEVARVLLDSHMNKSGLEKHEVIKPKEYIK